MIQITRAKFKNFRLLRNVELEFSCDSDHPLTVIRAENGSGKTTILTGMTWALFGDEALPTKRSMYRLHPIDWSSAEDGKTVDISVEVSFSMVDEDLGIQRYELIRSTQESLDSMGGFQAQKTELIVLHKSSKGDEAISNPNAFVGHKILPQSLKDIFFIDGDRALAFIEATDERSVKRERVERAVRSLLGLDILESAESHVNVSRREAVKQVTRQAQGTFLATLTEQENVIVGVIATLKEQKIELTDQKVATEGRRRKADEALKEALATGAGDRKKLESDMTDAEMRLSAERLNDKQLVQEHRSLMHRPHLLYAISGGALQKATQILSDLENRKIIPNTLPEIVQDRLNRGTCICGEDVQPGTKGYEVLSNLLAESQHLDESHDILLHLSNALRRAALDYDNPERQWSRVAKESIRQLGHSRKIQEEAEKQIADIRARIRQIPDKNLNELEKMLAVEDREYQRLSTEIAYLTERISRKEGDLKEVRQSRLEAQKKETKYARSLAEETAAQDLLSVLKKTIATLEGETLGEVSREMNDIFLHMIVAASEESSVIQQAELTQEHDILVHGPNGKWLDPDRDLSGAQRRALTLAFILALVKVSGVSAPNFIDTPLGMTSGPVRRAILEYTASKSAQPVLFLTGSEILEVEDILDQFVGKSFTLTNTDHYPSRVKNAPTSQYKETLICRCDHRSSCHICERVGGF
jgi:DNA sulfur modification protein DndD